MASKKREQKVQVGSWRAVTCFRDWYLQVCDRMGERTGTESERTEWGRVR